MQFLSWCMPCTLPVRHGNLSIPLVQAATGRTVDAGLAALLTAGVTLAVNSRTQPLAASRRAPVLAAAGWQQEAGAPPAGQRATARRLWGNWPALSATLLLMLDAAAPLVTLPPLHAEKATTGTSVPNETARGQGLGIWCAAGINCDNSIETAPQQSLTVAFPHATPWSRASPQIAVCCPVGESDGSRSVYCSAVDTSSHCSQCAAHSPCAGNTKHDVSDGSQVSA